jgi:hypothetical protein
VALSVFTSTNPLHAQWIQTNGHFSGAFNKTILEHNKTILFSVIIFIICFYCLLGFSVIYAKNNGAKISKGNPVYSIKNVANDSLFYIWVEAEDGAEYSPMIVKSDQAASQEIYLASWDIKTSLTVPPTDGNIVYTFNISKEGMYRLWARLITPDTASNSYWIKIDSSSWKIWEDIGSFTSWAWDSISLNNLSVGQHALIIAYRERNTRIDKLLVTNDSSYIPSGMGEPKHQPTVLNLYRSDVVDLHGNLQIIGTQLCDEQGKPLQLKGICTHGIQWFPLYKGLTIPNAVEFMGIDIIRPAFYIEDTVNGDFWNGYLAHPAEMKQWEKNYIEDAINAGIYVIIDWHIHNNPSQFTNEAIDFFTEMSKTYGQYPNVLFDICSEPIGGVSWDTIKAYAEQVIPVIRNNDPDEFKNIIIVGTPNWSQYVDVAANNPIAGYNNIMYALHFYAASHKGEFRNRTKDAISGTSVMGNNPNHNKIAIIASEFGTSDYGTSNNDFTEAKIWIDFLNSNTISWVNWSLGNKHESSSILKPTSSLIGPWTDSDYTLSGLWVIDKIKTDYFPPTSTINITSRPVIELMRNYPNPFNSSTIISFSLPSKSFVSLKIFNLIGREVATVVSEELSLGKHTRQWNANGLPSGVYFYRLQARQTSDEQTSSYTKTEKLVLLK